jgi:hypothetical protein
MKTTRGKRVAKNTMRWGGADNTRQVGGRRCEVMGQWRIQCKAMWRPKTQQEEGGKGHDARCIFFLETHTVEYVFFFQKDR